MQEETSKSAVLEKEKKERGNLEQVKRQQQERTLNKKKLAAARQEDIDHCVDRALRVQEVAMIDRMQKMQAKESKVTQVTEVRSQMSATAAKLQTAAQHAHVNAAGRSAATTTPVVLPANAPMSRNTSAAPRTDWSQRAS